ncbi:MAG TPA: choice-of-anchor M domain-containing protein [Phycisphaerae bacterium]|nr:choice-of-anchor M domain-containing protein [Phycisphaerae bacterium]
MHLRIAHYLTAISFVCVLTAATQRAAAQQTWTSGHGDIGIAYEDGWDLHIHAEGAIIEGVEYPDDEFDAADVRILLPASTQTVRPAGANWDPIGVSAGQPYWALPQTEVVGVPFVGFGTEEILSGDFAGDAITLTLTGVASPSGTGNFSLYQTDAFGEPTFHASSADGLDASDSLALNAEDHLHANLAFTEMGLWAITFEASGTHSVHGFVTGEGTYLLGVVPEPGTAAMLLLSGVLALRRRTR